MIFLANPRLRIKILDFHSNDRDKVRKANLQKVPVNLCESLILSFNECSALPKSGQGLGDIYIHKQ